MKSMNAIAALWPCLAQLNANFATACVPLEIISMHSKRTPSTSAGEKFDWLAFLFFNLLWIFSQEHACARPCEMLGICHVDTTPHSIESTFIGRHERFQYTKVWNDITLHPITKLGTSPVHSRSSLSSLCYPYSPERGEAFRAPCPFHSARRIPLLQRPV